MGRTSDTRMRTREAAANLVAEGRSPHELTVDLIHAEIRQGSRTTINDELKLWKGEQAKFHALHGEIPPVVAQAMTSLWVLAVEEGEKTFEQQRESIEAERDAAVQQAQTLESALAGERDRMAGLEAQWQAQKVVGERLREELLQLHGNLEAAQSRQEALEQQWVQAQAEARQQLADERAAAEVRLTALQASMVAQEREFRAEIDKATERLEGVRKHVMLQVADAREETRQAQALLAKTREQAERLQREREDGMQQLATVQGRLEAELAQSGILERRALVAEQRLEEWLKATNKPARLIRKTPARPSAIQHRSGGRD